MARAIMLQGTGSDVGKTVLVAGLCRAARNRGMTRSPVQAAEHVEQRRRRRHSRRGRRRRDRPRAMAAGDRLRRAAPSIHMNPVLLKPQSDIGAQVVVQGKVFGEAKARDYQASEAEADGCGARIPGPRWARAPISSSSRVRGRRPRSISGRATSPIWALPPAPTCRWCWSATSTAAASSPRSPARI